jgi:hypothetical protein
MLTWIYFSAQFLIILQHEMKQGALYNLIQGMTWIVKTLSLHSIMWYNTRKMLPVKHTPSSVNFVLINNNIEM